MSVPNDDQPTDYHFGLRIVNAGLWMLVAGPSNGVIVLLPLLKVAVVAANEGLTFLSFPSLFISSSESALLKLVQPLLVDVASCCRY